MYHLRTTYYRNPKRRTLGQQVTARYGIDVIKLINKFSDGFTRLGGVQGVWNP